MTAINTTFDDNEMLTSLAKSVGDTGKGFVVIYKNSPKYIDSISELRNWLRKNGLYIHEYQMFHDMLHFVFVRSERGGD
tara:strand:- start:4324 stop:4560 length:237 start_codon:yes stop_codon:yes gene_type:complete